MKKAQTEKKKMILEAQLRTVFGKKNKNLRKQGLLPGNIYGTNFPSQAVSVNYIEFKRTYRIVGETGIVYVKTEKEEVPTLVTALQRDPLEGLLLHVDFRKVDLNIKIEAEVPLTFVGVAPAANAGGVILTQTDKVTVEALPQNIPHNIEVDLSELKEVGNEIKVSQLPKNELYVIMTDAEKVLVSVAAHKEESVIAETTAAAAPEVLTAKPEGEGEEGAAATTTPAEPAKKEVKKEAKKE
ncbi:MAG: 50S ribosomal protein L25 [Microgenomates group bacterium]